MKWSFFDFLFVVVQAARAKFAKNLLNGSILMETDEDDLPRNNLNVTLSKVT